MGEDKKFLCVNFQIYHRKLEPGYSSILPGVISETNDSFMQTKENNSIASKEYSTLRTSSRLKESQKLPSLESIKIHHKKTKSLGFHLKEKKR